MDPEGSAAKCLTLCRMALIPVRLLYSHVIVVVEANVWGLLNPGII